MTRDLTYYDGDLDTLAEDEGMTLNQLIDGGQQMRQVRKEGAE